MSWTVTDEIESLELSCREFRKRIGAIEQQITKLSDLPGGMDYAEYLQSEEAKRLH